MGRGGGQGLAVGLPGQGRQLGLHLRGAAGDATRADLEVDACNRALLGPCSHYWLGTATVIHDNF